MPKQLLIGVYKVCAKWTNGGKRYYQVIGWTEAGDRVRSRFDTEDLAKAEVNRLIGEDEKIRLARRQQGLAIAEDKCVFDSNQACVSFHKQKRACQIQFGRLRRPLLVVCKLGTILPSLTLQLLMWLLNISNITNGAIHCLLQTFSMLLRQP